MAEKIVFDHYEVLPREDGSLFELGRGAMGITYKAFDTNLRVNVALKVINAKYLESEVAQQRFLREARAARALGPVVGRPPSYDAVRVLDVLLRAFGPDGIRELRACVLGPLPPEIAETVAAGRKA